MTLFSDLALGLRTFPLPLLVQAAGAHQVSIKLVYYTLQGYVTQVSKTIYFLKLDFVVAVTDEHGLWTRVHLAGKVISRDFHMCQAAIHSALGISKYPFLYHCLR